MGNDLVFPSDEHKTAVKWQKGSDFMDGSARYTFEGRDPQNTYERFQVVIYSQRKREFSHDSTSVRKFYYGYVRDNEKECSDTVGRFKTLAEAKTETLKLFNKYMAIHAAEAQAQDTNMGMRLV